MSFFYPNEMSKINEEIDYDYSKIELNQRNIEKKMSGVANSRISSSFKPTDVEGELINKPNKLYEINLPFKKPNFNLSSLLPTSFLARKIYITGLLHNNIANVSDNNKSIVGELIIEHKPKTAVNQTIYTCFLLESDNGDNDTNKLLSYINNNDKEDSNVNFNMNELFSKQTKCIKYRSQYDFVIIYMRPIKISNENALFIQDNLTTNTDLFEISAPTESYIIDLVEEKSENTDKKSKKKTKSSQKETFIGRIFGNVKEGMSNDIYIDCQPVDESDETEAAYTTSLIDSEDSTKKQTSDFFNITSNFFMFIIIAAVSSMAIPMVYKIAIIKNLVNWKLEETSEPSKLKKYLRMADYSIIFMVFVYLIHYIRIGTTQTGKEIYTIFFLLLGVMSAFGYSIIQLKKKNVDYMTVKVPEMPPIILEYLEGEAVEGISFKEMIQFPFKAAYELLKLSFFAILLITTIIYSIFLSILNVKDSGFWLSEFLFFNTTVLSPLIYLLLKGSV